MGASPSRVWLSACEAQSSLGTPVWVLHKLLNPAFLKMIKRAWKGRRGSGSLPVLPMWKQTWLFNLFLGGVLSAPLFFCLNPYAGTEIEFGLWFSIGLEEAVQLASGMAGLSGEDGSVSVAQPGHCLGFPRQLAPTARTRALKTCPIRAEFGGVQLWPAKGHHGLSGCGEKRARRTQISPVPTQLMCRESLSELPCSPHCFSIENNF